jgi:hypothetical protein
MEGWLSDHQTCSSQRRPGKKQDFLFVEGACTVLKYTIISHQVKIKQHIIGKIIPDNWMWLL